MVLAAVAIVWHQQRSNERLRREMREEIAALRTEMREEIAALRTEMHEEFAAVRAEIGAVRTGLGDEIGAVRTGLGDKIGAVRAELAANGQRLARIEGYLGIGMPAEAAAAAAGSALVQPEAAAL